MFDDIVAGYKKIEQDYKARATGAKRVYAAVFFEFHPVNRVLLGIKNSDQKWDKSINKTRGTDDAILIDSFIILLFNEKKIENDKYRERRIGNEE